ncbi:MAG TPA: PEP-CTERM sorting domain-containing protein [Vicinamibacterales bacterium]|nr:PEP-CTERM sorting domain-containing protein [Vicinamibacterales bacterium]
MVRTLKTLLFVLLLSVVFVPAVLADEIVPEEEDPATLHIGTGAGTPCAQGCGGDPNTITATVLSIFQNHGGAPDLLDPLLLILGIPNTSGLGSAPAIASITEYDPYPGSSVGSVTATLGGSPIYGWSGAGFVGNWTSSDPQVYNFIGLEPPATNSSNNATNWFGVAPSGTTFYGIYVYAIHGTLGDKGLFNVTWAGSGLPEGTIAIAYGCAVLGRDGRCYKVKNVYSTPFTESGRVGRVPEPSSLALFATGLAMTAGARLRRSRAARAALRGARTA